MQRMRILGLALVAVFAISAIGVSSASAAKKYVYMTCEEGKGAGEKFEDNLCTKKLGTGKFEKKELAAGETREVTSKAKAGTEFVLKGEQLGFKSTTKCKKEKLNAAEKPVINGGAPGKSEKEKIEFSECTAEISGFGKCEKVEIENVPTINEIVTVVKPAAKAGQFATLFTPAGGKKLFTTIKFTNCGGISTKAEVEGTSAALNSPQEKLVKAGILISREAVTEEITEVEKLGGGKAAVGLKFAGNKATLNGEAEVELVSKAAYGVF